MGSVNTIKVKQIDTDDLAAWLQLTLGASIDTDNSVIVHGYNEFFQGSLVTNGPFVNSGISSFSGRATFASGFSSNSGITVAGEISGQTLNIQNFFVNSGVFKTGIFGSLKATGIPIYSSGDASIGVTLPSGTIFGVRQTINSPTLERDASGQLMPATGSGISVIMLCISVGS